ncbi:GntR family transcriptional regulator [Gordonia sp. NPDC003425]
MQSVSGRDKAYEYVRDVVLTSPTAAGAFLNEQELATRIGVSRTPVREALLMLQAEGLVELVPKRGAHVPAMSGRQLRELMDLRGVLERHAASAVIRTGTAPVAAMRAALAQQHALADIETPGAAKEFIDIDGRFHQLLIDAAGSELLSTTYAGLRTRQLRAGLTALSTTHDRQQAVCREHEAIVEALELGDDALTHKAIDDHLQITLQALLLG